MTKLVFFTEELSLKGMLDILLPRLLPENTTHQCIAFEGKQDLRKRLPIKLKSWRRSDIQFKFIVLRDQDLGDCRAIKSELVAICRRAERPNTMVRIVCRELESWYLADLAAVEKGLGVRNLSANQENAKYRAPDRLPHPKNELKKLCHAYRPVSGSRKIAPWLDLGNTRSVSFRHFVLGVQRLCQSGLPRACPIRRNSAGSSG